VDVSFASFLCAKEKEGVKLIPLQRKIDNKKEGSCC
jgi:hypothetical protein